MDDYVYVIIAEMVDMEPDQDYEGERYIGVYGDLVKAWDALKESIESKNCGESFQNYRIIDDEEELEEMSKVRRGRTIRVAVEFFEPVYEYQYTYLMYKETI